MSESPSRDWVDLAVKGFAVGLLAIILVSAVFRLQMGGVGALPQVFVGLYIAALVVYGVFRGAFDTRRFRVALAVGLLLWGGLNWLESGLTIIVFVLIAGGAVLLAQELGT